MDSRISDYKIVRANAYADKCVKCGMVGLYMHYLVKNNDWDTRKMMCKGCLEKARRAGVKVYD